MAEVRELAGCPSLKRVREVKAFLWNNFRSKPQLTDKFWKMTWDWANNWSLDRARFDFSKAQRKKWPPASEIASQYIFLCIADVKAFGLLKLPFMAGKFIPEGYGLFSETRKILDQARRSDERLEQQILSEPKRITKPKAKAKAKPKAITSNQDTAPATAPKQKPLF